MMKQRLLLAILLIFISQGCSVRKEAITPENALSRYLNNDDRTFSWELKEKFSIDDADVAVILLTSQQWRGNPWVHQLTIISPKEIATDGALLFITGGSNKDNEPKWKGKNDGGLKMWVGFSIKNKAVVGVLGQVPNQPLYDDLTEDALISYTLHNFKSDRDFSWPLLFPMVKSASKSMDAVQQYVKKELKTNINKFVVSGASKRGWTTWLTASQDKRVVAIAPMVIDVLNMPVNIDYQKKVWGDYSVEIEDYVKLGLAQDMSSPEGIDLVTMIDPYSYRKNLIMPKMLMMGTNDQYWPVDAVKNYFDDIPGDNYIHYEPNVGHNIGDGAGTIKALSAFFNISVYGKTYNQCSWEVNSDSTATLLNIKGSAGLREVTLWICESPDLDFRNDGFKGTRIDFSDSESIQVKVDHPLSGYRAFYADLLYPDPVEGTYSLTTRMFVSGKGELFLEKGE